MENITVFLHVFQGSVCWLAESLGIQEITEIILVADAGLREGEIEVSE